MVVDDETAYNPPSSKGNDGNYIGIVLLLVMRLWMAGNREDDHGLCILPGMRGYENHAKNALQKGRTWAMTAAMPEPCHGFSRLVV
jgi:hypothetical protein